MTTPLVSAAWLNENLDMPNLVVLNATLAKVTGHSEEVTQQIPGARNFDIKNTFSDTSSYLPNTVPSSTQFETEAKKLGVNTDSMIVVYDEHGIYSSPRAWWLFKTFGHEKVAVLDGGLPAWMAAGLLTEQKRSYQGFTGNFKASYRPNNIKDYSQILAAINEDTIGILDARSADRFSGQSPEPREGLRSGHIPSSVNLPYTSVLNDDYLRTKEELMSIFNKYEYDNLIMSCGSGITACILALGAEVAGHKTLSIYDGSWTEWGSREELPIEKLSD